jgi:hypothetical protein
MRDITSIHTTIRLIKLLHGTVLIAIGSTDKKLSLASGVREAVSALLQPGCVVDRSIPTASAPTATDTTTLRRSVHTREVRLRARVSNSRATILIARAARRIGTGRTIIPRRKTFGMCAED